MSVPQQRIGELVAHARRLAGVTKDACLRLIDRYRPGQRQAAEAPEPIDYGPPAQIPDGRRVYAVGDIHGRADLLAALLKQIQADARVGDYKGPPILIFLGDYIDRGMQSREVIDLLMGELVSPFET